MDRNSPGRLSSTACIALAKSIGAKIIVPQADGLPNNSPYREARIFCSLAASCRHERIFGSCPP